MYYNCYLHSFNRVSKMFASFRVILVIICALISATKKCQCTLQAPDFLGSSILSLERYSYNGNPSTQFKGYKICKTGHLQSPIDISGPFITDTSSRLHFNDEFYKAPSTSGVFNEGHYPQVVHTPDVPKYFVIFQGIKYRFLPVNYHYGLDDSVGSEHTLNGKRYPLELHLISYQEKYGSMRNALQRKDGVLIIAVFYEIGSFNAEQFGIVASFPFITQVNQSLIVSPPPVINAPISLMPDINSKFYYYEGSLTAPRCPQTVKWIVFDEAKQLSQEQMQGFRGFLKDNQGNLITKNWRITQPRNGRPIYFRPQINS